MKSRWIGMVPFVLVVAVLASCDSDPGTTPTSATSPTSTVTTTKAPDVAEHESGPESPLTYGLEVPPGATQLGPLIRYRSARLITAYEPELRAALAQKAAEDQAKEAEANRKGTPLPSTTPTPDTRPSADSFTLLDQPPKPDSTISLMRIDGKPSDVVRRMLAQIGAVLPDSHVVTDDLSKYCKSVERRISSCRLAVRGLTKDERDVRITMAVDPGRLSNRTSPPSDLTRPVMSVTIEYVGEPRKGQLTRESNDIGDVANVDSAEKSGLIWPKMDVDAPATTKLVNGWVAPTTATILLSSYNPQFVEVTTSSAADADQIAEQFAVTNSAKGDFVKDVVEDLNEVSTTYTATAKDGSIARGIFVQSARGNYTALFYYPALK
jgi:hypothetical protein